MLYKNITVNIPHEVKMYPLGSNSLVILKIDGILTERQFEHLKSQLGKDNKNCRFLLLEDGVSLDSILTDIDKA